MEPTSGDFTVANLLIFGTLFCFIFISAFVAYGYVTLKFKYEWLPALMNKFLNPIKKGKGMKK